MRLASLLFTRGLILSLLLVAPGCVSSIPWLSNFESTPPSACQAIALWDSRIHVTQDTFNGGRPVPGFAGRLYIMGSESGAPQKGDGTVAVDVYDVTHLQEGVQPRYMERWQFDPVSLAKLLRHDKIGWGYTLFLPWSTYSPEVSRVQLKVCYTPANGNPLYTEPAIVSLRNQVSPLTHTREILGQQNAAAQNPVAQNPTALNAAALNLPSAQNQQLPATR